ncbi:MAG: hypothetical protein LUG83_01365, partial [Lachnospiraceae bacterium]|nr:hypothetical protein [Lachnospiraceae bacterium]
VLLISICCIIWGGIRLFYGKTSELKGNTEYSSLTFEEPHSPLIVFPDKEIQSVSEDFYYQFSDEIFSPVCQIYLKKEYTPEQFINESKRLESEQLNYVGQTNNLYFDENNFYYDAYVALADWSDRYEYALMLNDENTIIYVYLENMTKEDLYMSELYLPLYFKDNNESDSIEESMTEKHRSFYAFKIGNKYVDCMDLVK